MTRIYIKEADSTINGGVNDVSEYVGSDKEIICTYGCHNAFYVNGDANGSLLRVQDVRIINMGKDITTFECWANGDRTNSISVEIPTLLVVTITCGGHFGHTKVVDMSHY